MSKSNSECDQEKQYSLSRSLADSMAAFAVAGILTIAFLGSLDRAAIASLCCFAVSLPFLAAYKLSTHTEFGRDMPPRSAELLSSLAFVSHILTIVGFGCLLWTLSRLATVGFIASTLICIGLYFCNDPSSEAK
jgi:hypothetical protein